VFLKEFFRDLCKLFVEVPIEPVKYISLEVYPIVVYLIGKGAVEVWSIPHYNK
jgi:hypothetical protein